MIIITRTSQFSNKFIPISIYIDGVKIGSLRDGERSEFRVAAGLHTLQAKLNISASNSIEFELNEKNNIEFELGSNINVGLNVLIALSHPAMFAAIFLIDSIIHSDIFLVSSLFAFIGYEIWTYIRRKRQKKVTPESERYYLYLKRT